MSTIQARRKLATHAENGRNWRFRALLDAYLSTDISRRDMAEAWPDPGSASDYKFLANPEEERKMGGIAAHKGSDRYDVIRLAESLTSKASVSDKKLGTDTIEEVDSRTLKAHKDDVIRRTLFAGASQEEVDRLFREELFDVVIAGSETRKIARDVADVINVDTRTGDIPVRSDDPFADKVAQGAPIRDDREQYDTIRFSTDKYGQNARVTDEMVDQANIDAIERQIEYVGAAVENAINRRWLTTLIDNAGESVTRDTSLDDPEYSALNAAYGKIDANDFPADTFTTHPQFRTDLYDNNALRFANRSGSDEIVRDRVFDPLLDMEHRAASGRTYSPDGDNAWGFSSSGDVGAMVYNSENTHILMYAPNGQGIEIKDYDDPIRDLTGVNARVHVDSVLSQERAVAQVLHE